MRKKQREDEEREAEDVRKAKIEAHNIIKTKAMRLKQVRKLCLENGHPDYTKHMPVQTEGEQIMTFAKNDRQAYYDYK